MTRGCDCGNLTKDGTPMSEPLDPFDLLRELNPVAPADVAGSASSAQARHALEEIVATEPDASRKRAVDRRYYTGRRRGVLVLASIALVSAAAAAAWALTQGPTKKLTIGCYASADLQARTVVVAAGTRSPVQTCREVWRRGDFGRRSTPELEACVLPSGAIGVFPAAKHQACRKLELAPVAPNPTSTTRSANSPIRLKSALVQQFVANPCMNEKQATATVEATIHRLGFAAWRIRADAPFTSTRPCASLAFDEERHLVELVPLPKRS